VFYRNESLVDPLSCDVYEKKRSRRRFPMNGKKCEEEDSCLKVLLDWRLRLPLAQLLSQEDSEEDEEEVEWELI